MADPPIEHKNVVVSKRLIAINSASQVIARILNITILLWAYQYLLQRISAEEFAVLPVVTALMVFAPVFFSFFTGGIARYVVEAYARGDNDRVAAVVSSIVPPMIMLTALFGAGGILFALNIEHVLNIAPQMIGDARIMAILLILGFCFQMAALPFSIGHQVQQRFVELNLLGVARDAIRIVLLLSLLLGIGPQVIWVVVATFVSEAAFNLAVLYRSRVLVPELRFKASRFSVAQAWELTNFGLWTTLGRMGTMLYANAGTLILNLFGTPVDVTSYHIAATLFRQLDTLVNLAVAPLQPVVTAMHALNDAERLKSTMLSAGRYALWAALAIATPLSIFAGPFVDLYAGAEYQIAGLAIVILMLNFLSTAPTVILAMVSIATGRLKPFFLPAFLMQVAGFLMMLGFSKYAGAGVIGITAALAAITILGQVLYFWPLNLKLGVMEVGEFIRRTLLPGMLPALIGGVVWVGIAWIMPPQTWIALFLSGACGGVVYLAALAAFCLQPDEQDFARRQLRRVGI